MDEVAERTGQKAQRSCVPTWLSECFCLGLPCTCAVGGLLLIQVEGRLKTFHLSHSLLVRQCTRRTGKARSARSWMPRSVWVGPLMAWRRQWESNTEVLCCFPLSLSYSGCKLRGVLTGFYRTQDVQECPLGDDAFRARPCHIWGVIKPQCHLPKAFMDTQSQKLQLQYYKTASCPLSYYLSLLCS